MRRRFGFKAFGILAFIGVVLFGLSAVVMYLWNFALAPAVNLININFWQAMGILVLSKILLSGFRPPHRSDHKPPWRKWYGQNEEEREAFRKRWNQYCEKRD